MKRTTVYSMSTETRRQNIALFDVSWEYVSGNSNFSPLGAQMPRKVPKVLILELQINFGK